MQTAKEKFMRELLQGLRDKYPENVDVSETQVREYIKNKKKRIPEEVEGLDGVLNLLSEQCVYRYRNEESDHIKQRYFRIGSQKLPDEIRSKVEKVIIRTFSGKTEISSADLGNTLNKAGINYEDFKYKDLTDFMREFNDFIMIKGNRREDGNAYVAYCVNQVAHKKIIEKHGGENEKMLKRLFDKEKYVELMEWIRDHQINLFWGSNAAVWNMAIRAIAHIEENNGIPQNISLDTSELMELFEEAVECTNSKVKKAGKNARKNPYLTLVEQIRMKHGRDSLLVYYVLQIGRYVSVTARDLDRQEEKIAGIRVARECYAEALFYCAEYYPEVFKSLWKEYKNLYFQPKWLEAVFARLYEEKRFDLFEFVYNERPEECNDYTTADAIKVYVDIIHSADKENEDWNLPVFSKIGAFGNTKTFLVESILLDALRAQGRLEEVCQIVNYFIEKTPNTIEKFKLNIYLVRYEAERSILTELMAVENKSESINKLIGYLTVLESDYKGAFKSVNPENLKEMLTGLAESYKKDIRLDKKLAENMLHDLRECKYDRNSNNNYKYAIIGLALDAEHPYLVALMFTFMSDQQKNYQSSFMEDVRKTVRQCLDIENKNEAYITLINVVNRILTGVDLEKTRWYFGFAEKQLMHDETFERDPEQYKKKKQEEDAGEDKEKSGKELSFIKLCIANYDNPLAWQPYKEYSHARGNVRLDYAISLYILYNFSDFRYPLTNCIDALRNNKKDCFPTNFLENNLLLYKKGYDIPSYWNAFAMQIAQPEWFELFTTQEQRAIQTDILKDFLKEISSKEYYANSELRVVLSIIQYQNSLELFFEYFMDKKEQFINALVSNMPNTIRFLVLFACDETMWTKDKIEEQRYVNLIRDEIAWQEGNVKDVVALNWISTMYDERAKGNSNEHVFETFGEIMGNYPKEPSDIIVKEYLLGNNTNQSTNYLMLEYWIKLFDQTHNLLKANSYLMSRKMPESIEERTQLYSLQLEVLKRIIASDEAHRHTLSVSFSRVCKNYLALKYLTGDEFGAKYIIQMEAILKQKKSNEYYENYKLALERFVASDISEEWKEKVLFAGMTLKWDFMMEELLNDEELYEKSVDLLRDYIYTVEFRGFRKELLGRYIKSQEATLKDDNTSIDNYQVNIEKAVLDFCPEFDTVVKYLSQIVDKHEKDTSIRLLKEIQQSRNFKKIGAVLKKNSKDEEKAKANQREIIVPSILLLNYPEDICKEIGNAAFEANDRIMALVNDERIQRVLGEFFSKYYLAIYHATKKDYEKAKSYLGEIEKIEEIPQNKKIPLRKLKNAIKNKYEVNQSIEDERDLKKYPSFMKTRNPEGENFEDLWLQFNVKRGKEFLDEKYCEIAEKIYSYVLEGEIVSGYDFFIAQWGLYASRKETDVCTKVDILLDLMEHTKIEEHRKEIAEQFQKILAELEFFQLRERLEKIKRGLKEFSNNFEGTEEFRHHITIIDKLHEVNEWSKVADAKKNRKKIEETKAEIEKKYKFLFAIKAVKFIDKIIDIIDKTSIFEIEILNENDEFSGEVFYQIKKVADDRVADIKLDITLKNMKGDVLSKEENIKIEKFLNGQIYAGEYQAELLTTELNMLKCEMLLTYSTVDTEQERVPVLKEKELQVVNNKLEVFKKSPKTYVKLIRNIKQDRLVIREDVFEELRTELEDNMPIALYSLNDIGRKGVLRYIEKTLIPDFDEEGHIICSFDAGDTSKSGTEVIGDLLSKLIKTVTKSLNDDDERNEVKSAVLDADDSINGIKDILEELSEKLIEIDKRVYVLWKNFDQIIVNTSIDAGSMSFLKSIDDWDLDGIKFIISGETALLEAICSERNDNRWNEIFALGNTTNIKVGNLKEEDFEKLICSESILGTDMKFTEESLAYLWAFTHGHAQFSAIVADKLLDMLNGKAKRLWIYPSDVNHAIMELQSDDTTTISTQISMNLKEEAKTVGRILADYVKEDGIYQKSYENIWIKFPYKNEKDAEKRFNAAINSLIKRDMLEEEIVTTINGKEQKEYKFTSDLYMERFINFDIQREEVISEVLIEEKEQFEDSIWKYIGNNPEFVKKIKEIIGNTENNYIKEQNNYIEEQNNSIKEMHIENVEVISNSINTILTTDSPEKLLEAYNNLPKLKDFVGDKEARLDSRLKAINNMEGNIETLEDEKVLEEMQLAYDEELASVENAVEKTYREVLEKVGAIDCTKLEIDTNIIDNFNAKTENKFAQELGFATQLHAIFTKLKEIPSIDYCPVTIMYCKLVEALLKEYHIDIYQKKFTNNTVKENGITFGAITDAVKNKLTIGSFTHPIMKRIDYSGNGNHIIDVDAIKDNFSSEIAFWTEHAGNLANVLVCRNKSAHASTKISEDELRNLVEVLFVNGELIKIVDAPNKAN